MLRNIVDRFRRLLGKGAPTVFHAPKPERELVPSERRIIDDFHNLYYSAWGQGMGTIDISWLGHHTLKCPLDLWVYQEILFETRPDVIIETGTCFGGSALYLGSICDLLGSGRVISIDVQAKPGLPKHPRVEFWAGSSTADEIIERVKREIAGKRCMVILDSDHTYQHVARELALYWPLVARGCYLIVEDTNVNGHPTAPDHGPGPMEAVKEFMLANKDFTTDKARERFMMTLNPDGYLKRR